MKRRNGCDENSGDRVNAKVEGFALRRKQGANVNMFHFNIFLKIKIMSSRLKVKVEINST